MPFFLLGRGPDEQLRLLTGVVWESRRDALDELALITGEPGFADWNDEVFVVDIDQATPVLLVRPAAIEAQEPTAEGAAAAEEPPDGEPFAEEVVDAHEQPAEEEAGEGPAAPRGIPVPIEVAAESLVVETPVIEPAATSATEPVDTAWAEVALAQEGQADEPTPADTAAIVESLDEPEAWEAPSDEALDSELDTVLTTQPDAAGSDGPEEVEFVLPPAEQLEDEEDIDAAVTNSSPWPWERVSDEVEPPVALDQSSEPARTEGAPDETQPEVPEPASHDEEAASDFIFALEPPLEDEAPFAPPPPGYSAEEAEPVVGMSCDDCIYVETCPNKDERDPASCGSFQWR